MANNINSINFNITYIPEEPLDKSLIANANDLKNHINNLTINECKINCTVHQLEYPYKKDVNADLVLYLSPITSGRPEWELKQNVLMNLTPQTKKICLRIQHSIAFDKKTIDQGALNNAVASMQGDANEYPRPKNVCFDVWEAANVIAQEGYYPHTKQTDQQFVMNPSSNSQLIEIITKVVNQSIQSKIEIKQKQEITPSVKLSPDQEKLEKIKNINLKIKNSREIINTIKLKLNALGEEKDKKQAQELSEMFNTVTNVLEVNTKEKKKIAEETSHTISFITKQLNELEISTQKISDKDTLNQFKEVKSRASERLNVLREIEQACK